MAHTPGPWFAFNANYQAEHEHTLLPIFVIGPKEFHTVAQVRAGNDDDDLPQQAADNARLIAAAPDLLAALVSLMPPDFDEHPQDLMPEYHAARAVIAKATGS